MTCDETPDDGSGSGVYNTTWNNLKIYRTNITYTCPVGQAFDTIYNQTVNNTCNYQTQDAAQVSWTYSGASALPPCIRKYQTNCLIMFRLCQRFLVANSVSSILGGSSRSFQSLFV